MKTALIYIALSILSFIVNFGIYNYSFITQATPFMTEEHRVDSGLIMLKTTLPAYIISSIILSYIFYLVATKLRAKK